MLLFVGPRISDPAPIYIFFFFQINGPVFPFFPKWNTLSAPDSKEHPNSDSPDNVSRTIVPLRPPPFHPLLFLPPL